MKQNYKQKYLKYKKKYLNVKNETNTIQNGGKSNVILLNNTTISIKDQYFDDFASWLLYSLREVFGYMDVRHMLINQWVNSVGLQGVYNELIQFDPLRKNDDNVIQLCNDIIQNQTHNIFIFTGTNLPDIQTNETHYNIFIVNKQQKKVIAIDPAILQNGKPGIYHPFLAKYTIFPIFKKHKYTTDFMRLSHPAQDIEHDVFCQTWTLLILYLWLSNGTINGTVEIPIQIPEEQIDRYALLLQFYKQCVSGFPEIATYLNSTYKDNIINIRKNVAPGNNELAKINASATLLNNVVPEDFVQ